MIDRPPTCQMAIQVTPMGTSRRRQPMIVHMEEQVSWRATPYRAPVLDTQGNVIGRTESLLADEEADIFHGLAVKLSDGSRMVEIPAARISRITSAVVHTDVEPGGAASLQPYREEHWYHLGWGGLFRRRPEWREGE